MKYFFIFIIAMFCCNFVSADLIGMGYGSNDNLIVSSNEYVDSFFFGNSVGSINVTNQTVANFTQGGGLLLPTKTDISFICGLFGSFIADHTNSSGALNYDDSEYFAYKENVSYVIPAFMGDSYILSILNKDCKEPSKLEKIKEFPWLYVLIVLISLVFISAYYVNKNALFAKLASKYNKLKKSKEKEDQIKEAPKMNPARPIN